MKAIVAWAVVTVVLTAAAVFFTFGVFTPIPEEKDTYSLFSEGEYHRIYFVAALALGIVALYCADITARAVRRYRKTRCLRNTSLWARRR